ncbi:MAG: TatD family hydrolase [Clostridia bacterium]|nr:TatD family hydrolase [Clostridia bacterium]
MTDLLKELPECPAPIFDSHAHYDDDCFDQFRDTLFSQLPKNNVGGIITCGCDGESSAKALALAEKYDYIYAAVGIHPGNIQKNTPISEIESLAKNKKCVAIGEIGLDYYWDKDNKEAQKQVFENQLILAGKLSLPVIVHDREAHSDTLELLKKHHPKGVVHCFSGSEEMAAEILKLGMYIGIGGVITFKNAKKLPDVVKMLPLDRFVLETDAPYLTPVPYRSKINNSAMIYFTAEKIAEIRGSDTASVLNAAYQNTVKLFNL